MAIIKRRGGRDRRESRIGHYSNTTPHIGHPLTLATAAARYASSDPPAPHLTPSSAPPHLGHSCSKGLGADLGEVCIHSRGEGRQLSLRGGRRQSAGLRCMNIHVNIPVANGCEYLSV